jgi:hypothetical protein
MQREWGCRELGLLPDQWHLLAQHFQHFGRRLDRRRGLFDVFVSLGYSRLRFCWQRLSDSSLLRLRCRDFNCNDVVTGGIYSPKGTDSLGAQQIRSYQCTYGSPSNVGHVSFRREGSHSTTYRGMVPSEVRVRFVKHVAYICVVSTGSFSNICECTKNGLLKQSNCVDLLRERSVWNRPSAIILPSNRLGRGFLNTFADAWGCFEPKKTADLSLPSNRGVSLLVSQRCAVPRAPPSHPTNQWTVCHHRHGVLIKSFTSVSTQST